jgi:competence protein ComEA
LIKNNLKSFFTFSKKELNGLLVFCCLFSAVGFAPMIYRQVYQPEVFSFTDFKNDIEKFKASEQNHAKFSYNKFKDEVEKKLVPGYFNFDPNNLPAESWHRLGLTNRQINVIKNYEAKGGHFYHREDLKKMYSISKEEYAGLEPYITIPENKKASKFETPVKIAEKSAKSVILVELNAADSAQLETIRGVGPAFASRIVKYRNRLGGFYSKEQLREIYGVDSAKYEQLQSQVAVDNSMLQKININTATFDDLKRHPYLTYKQMNAIIQYRKQHGSYNTIADLKKIAIINTEVLYKIEPYLIF